MAKELADFLEAKKQRADAELGAVDWQKRREEWLAAIKTLYADILNWLNEPIRRGVVTIQTQPRRITEEHLGAYEVEDLVIAVGDEKVTFSPKARTVVGAQGRVDVRGEAGESMFVVYQPGSRWSVVTSKYPSLRTEPLDEHSLNETMQAVMRP